MDKIYLIVTDEYTDKEIADRGIEILLDENNADEDFVFDTIEIEVGNRESIINALYKTHTGYYTLISEDIYTKLMEV